MGNMYMSKKGEHPNLIMVDHESGKMWSYAIPSKSISKSGGWLERRTARDIDNIGHKNIKVMIKSDQERSIVVLQHAIQRIREGKTVCINSPVGESESNGRVENGVRAVQEKVRALKSHLEEETKYELKPDDAIMSWLIRWVGEILI